MVSVVKQIKPRTPAVRVSHVRKLHPGDMAYMNDLRASMLVQSSSRTMAVLYLVASILLVALIWAAFARVEEVTKGQATIIPASREQIIQSLEGGILEVLNVREGDIVEKGQVLLKIDPTRAGAAYSEGYSKLIGLKGAVARLRAEAYQTPLIFPDDVQEDLTVVRQETKAYNARSRALSDSIHALEQSAALARSEIALAEPLSERGLISQVEILRMKRQASDLQVQMVERRNKYQADANAELSRLDLELAQTSQNLVGRKDIMSRTTVLAPVKGTIKKIAITTIGGVIQPGEHIMELVPLEDQLLVEAKIKPADVAFIHEGLPAKVKVSAYDYGIYGGLNGVVTHISPDTLRDEQRASSTGKPDETYYRVLVLTDKSSLDVAGKSLPIIPGMTATVEIRTGEKTILDYILKPVLKAREAFRER